MHGAGWWCYSAHPSGQARCVDPTANIPRITACWEQLSPLVPNPDYGDPGEPDRVVECMGDTGCQELQFPSFYHCAPNHSCAAF